MTVKSLRHRCISKIVREQPSPKEVLACVKVQSVKVCLSLQMSTTWVYTSSRNTLAHTKQITHSLFHCLVWGGHVFIESWFLVFTKQLSAVAEVFVGRRKCVCGEHIKHVHLSD